MATGDQSNRLPIKVALFSQFVPFFAFLVNLFIFLLFPENSDLLLLVFSEFVYFFTFPGKFNSDLSVSL